MLSDDTIRRIMESVGLSTGGGPFPIRNTERKFARACYVEGQRDAQERISGPNGYSEQSINAQAEIARLNERIAELEREVSEQARLLGISGSTEARLLARVAELEREISVMREDGRK